MSYRWRTIDIVIASVIAVAFGIIFWAWNFVWGATDAAFAFFPPAQTLLYGVWLMPAVLAGLIIRKPGAALYAETVAAVISALLAGLLTGLSAALFDFFAWNAATALWDYRIPYALLTVVSSTVIAGLGGWALTRALAPTGVLDRFAAGRDRALI